MKKILALLTLILTFNTYAQGTTDAIEAYLQERFFSIDTIGSMFFLGSTNQCDQKASVFVVGNLSSSTTAYVCELCLVNDSGYTQIDADYSECYRESN